MSGRPLNTDLRIRVDESTREDIEQLAAERSVPGNRVNISDIIRDALDEYLDRQLDGESPDPRPDEQPAD